MIHLQQPDGRTDSEPAVPRTSSGWEYYETLLTRLYDSNDSRRSLLGTVGITSCVHGEGVSTVAANLAIHAALAVSDPVLLFEVAAKCSSIEGHFGVDASTDLAELLSGRAVTAECIRPTRVDSLSVLAASTRGNGWGSFPSIARVLKEIRDEFAFVVVDLPPANETSPCLAMAGQMDGVLLTVEAERVPCQATHRAKQQLLHVGANLLGVILNKRREHIPPWLCRQA